MTALPSIPVLETERLRLRAPRLSDFEAFAAFGVSERAQGVGGPISEFESFSKLGSIIGHWALRGFGRWMVADRETDAPLGVVGPYFPHGWPEPELAWTVFAEAEGKGIAHEAVLAARAFAYDTLGWTTAVSMIVAQNTRSQALARRLGATPDGTFRHPEFGDFTIWRHPGPQEASR
ncbi:GNAT family N-acetyltransferase [Oceanicella sp. SM1341]|uniref:GNAT family N-acetyltransferase n=1 Tax=Oceanicella sp. SM1341 TaxID=1548889 RepID=UPI000E48EE0D|nr:GNAT family N-acetyltransferase [Oceanicella sp. SM1341]